MLSVLIVLLAVVLAVLMYFAARKECGVIELPFMAAAAFAGYLFPQIVALSDDLLMPADVLATSIIMAILCLIATYVGYYGSSRPASMFSRWEFNGAKLLIAAYALIVLGIFFFFQISAIAAEVSNETGGQWTGIITIYVFFSQMLTIGFVICVLLFLRSPSWPPLVGVFVGLVLYADRIFLHGRRTAAAELFLIGVMALWFSRRKLPPKYLVAAALIVGALIFNSIGDYRSLMLETDRTTYTGAQLDDLKQIDFVDNFVRLFSEGGHDWRNAAYAMYGAEATGVYDYGFSLWNGFVFRFIPAQFLGDSFKSGLLVDFAAIDFAIADYQPVTGSMVTGVADAFRSFHFLGAIKFFLIGVLMRRWFRLAERGNIFAQAISIMLIYPALIAFPATTDYFFLKFVELAIFLLPFMWFARTHRLARADSLGVARKVAVQSRSS